MRFTDPKPWHLRSWSHRIVRCDRFARESHCSSLPPRRRSVARMYPRSFVAFSSQRDSLCFFLAISLPGLSPRD